MGMGLDHCICAFHVLYFNMLYDCVCCVNYISGKMYMEKEEHRG